MSLYCQRCGTELEQARMYATFWLSFLNCSACSQAYLQVADPRWIYPLQFLELGVLPKSLSAPEEALAAAAANIVFIDYKTGSIVAFEKALLELSN